MFDFLTDIKGLGIIVISILGLSGNPAPVVNNPVITPTTIPTTTIQKLQNISPTNVPQNKNTPEPKEIKRIQIIKSEGKYSYFGQTVEYNFHFSKNGGVITGDFSGICSGTIDGNYDPIKYSFQAEGFRGFLNGILTGNCKSFIYKGSFNQAFEGQLNEEGKYIKVIIRDKKIMDLFGDFKLPVQ